MFIGFQHSQSLDYPSIIQDWAILASLKYKHRKLHVAFDKYQTKWNQAYTLIYHLSGITVIFWHRCFLIENHNWITMRMPPVNQTMPHMCPQITKFMGPTWGPPGSWRPQMAPCWPHEPCYQGHGPFPYLLQTQPTPTHVTFRTTKTNLEHFRASLSPADIFREGQLSLTWHSCKCRVEFLDIFLFL